MPERFEDGILYYRAKGRAGLAVAAGALLVALGLLVQYRETVGGIAFSENVVNLATYMGLPLGAVMVLANIAHLLARGPTFLADDDGITILYPRFPIGKIRWTAIDAFRPFKHQGKWYLGIVLEDPDEALQPFEGHLTPVLRRFGPSGVHLKIHGRMFDEQMKTLVKDLEEMRHVRSWRG